MNKEKIKSKIEELQNQLEEIKSKIEELQNQLEEIKNKEIIEKDKPLIIISKELKKEIRIYKWENKIFKDFIMPEGFNWCNSIDFIYIYDNDLIQLEKHPICYYCKNLSEKNIKNNLELSGLYVYSNSSLYSSNKELSDSNSDGRVVISKEIKEKENEN